MVARQKNYEWWMQLKSKLYFFIHHFVIANLWKAFARCSYFYLIFVSFYFASCENFLHPKHFSPFLFYFSKKHSIEEAKIHSKWSAISYSFCLLNANVQLKKKHFYISYMRRCYRFFKFLFKSFHTFHQFVKNYGKSPLQDERESTWVERALIAFLQLWNFYF
jgi:hypothetical protein